MNIWDQVSEGARRKAVEYTVDEYGADSKGPKFKKKIDKIVMMSWDGAYKALGPLAKMVGEDRVVFMGRMKDKLKYLSQKESVQESVDPKPMLPEIERMRDLAGIPRPYEPPPPPPKVESEPPPKQVRHVFRNAPPSTPKHGFDRMDDALRSLKLDRGSR